MLDTNKIYRYRIVNKYSLQELVNMDFYCKLPKEVNDPFDSRCLFDYEGTEEDYRKHYELCLLKQSPELTVEQRRQQIENFISTGLWQDHEFRERLFQPFREATQKMFDNFGMVCFSKINNDILMWSHYADHHRGFCLEFDRALLQEKCNAPLEDITYELPTFSKLMAKNVEHHIPKTLLLSKAKNWEYEEEVRMIVPLNSGKDAYALNGSYMKYPQEALTGVILGCEMPAKHKELIRNILSPKFSKFTFYCASKRNDAYKVDILPM